MYDRHTDTRQVSCEECGWKGRRMDCVHDYEPTGDKDVTPRDRCPECGSDNIVPV